MEAINFKFVEFEELFDELSPYEREELVARLFKKLSPDARLRVLGLADSSLTVLTGSLVSLNSEIAVNVSSSSFDPEALIKALIEYRRKQA